MVALNACYALGSHKHVFVDWNLVEPGYGVAWAGTTPGAWEMPTGIRLAVHKPRIDDGPLIQADRPWETIVGSDGTIFEDNGVYRFYYGIQSDAVGGDSSSSVLAYAESTDGVTWTKPKIGTVELNGSKDNNITYGPGVAGGRPVYASSVFKDPTGGPNDRYKLLYLAPGGEAVLQLYGAVSPDGLHWETLDEPLIPNYFADTQNVVGYDPKRGKYVMYLRGWTAFELNLMQGRRTIAYAESDRFDAWPRPEPIYSPDLHDGPDTDIYSNAYTPWPGADAYLMFPAFYQRNADVVEVQMLTSRDGVRWDRPTRDPMVPSGELGVHSEGCYYSGAGLVNFKPEETTLFYSPKWYTHNQPHFGEWQAAERPRGCWSTATWRTDGFMSLEAPDDGSFTTIPLTFDGNRLVINAWTRFGGEISFELADASPEHMGLFGEGKTAASAKAIPGRSFDDCDPFTGDSISHTITWGSESDISQWANRPVRLRVRMRRARLYALQTK